MEGLIFFVGILAASFAVPLLARYLEKHPPPEEEEKKDDVPLKAFFFDM